MLSKHGIQMEPGPIKLGSGGSAANGGGSGSGTEGDEIKYVKLAAEAGNSELAIAAAAAVAAAAAAGNGKGSRHDDGGDGMTDSSDAKFSVDALMVKQEEIEPVNSQSTMYQNFKNLFLDYALKNVPAQMQ